MFSKPKFFLDTSVCIDVARSNSISADDWARVLRRCKAKFRYCISPETVFELVAGLADSNEAHFTESQEPIRVLFPAGPKSFLDRLRVFVPNTVFGEKRKPVYSVETDFDLWIRTVLHAPDKKALQSGMLRIGLKGRCGVGLDLDHIRKSIRDIQAGYASRFDSLRKRGVPDLTRDTWAEMILQDLRKPITPQNLDLVCEKVDAAYQFDSYLWRFLRNPDYDFSKHRGEIVDAQQLYYLCDSNVYFVTNDRRLKSAISRSPQVSRVLTYQELLAMV
jgi:hypothetical protein